MGRIPVQSKDANGIETVNRAAHIDLNAVKNWDWYTISRYAAVSKKVFGFTKHETKKKKN